MRISYSFDAVRSAIMELRDRSARLGEARIVPLKRLLVRHSRNERTIGICAVVLIHVFAIWILVLSLRPAPSTEVRTATPISMVILGAFVAPHPTVQPELIDPTLPIVEPPDVPIEQDAGPSAILAADSSMLLAPRPDPAHLNVPPKRPPAAGNSGDLRVVLKVLVKADGAIGDAEIAMSCGSAELDTAAMSYVKSNWRFIPAMLGNRPVDDWTTIFVPFASAS